MYIIFHSNYNKNKALNNLLMYLLLLYNTFYFTAILVLCLTVTVEELSTHCGIYK